MSFTSKIDQGEPFAGDILLIGVLKRRSISSFLTRTDAIITIVLIIFNISFFVSLVIGCPNSIVSFFSEFHTCEVCFVLEKHSELLTLHANLFCCRIFFHTNKFSIFYHVFNQKNISFEIFIIFEI